MFKSNPINKARSPIIISTSEFKGRVNFDIRHWYKNFYDDWCPTKQGVSVPLQDAPALINAILVAVESVTSGERESALLEPKTSAYHPVVVAVHEFKGERLIDIRHYAIIPDQEKPQPTKKGVSLPLSEAEELVQVLTQARDNLHRPEAEIVRELGFEVGEVERDPRMAMAEF